mmetsp:Transcript_6131/g.7134  ORF Transcript_6131/g.7134 Transcript_6131/m.7134 type:complete len:294 (+) Transcript_6131:32-913(+)
MELKENVEMASLPNRKKLEELAKQCPEATEEERYRFLNKRKGDYDGALEQLQSYIQWRQHHNLDGKDDSAVKSSSSNEERQSCNVTYDEHDWDSAASAAIAVSSDNNEINNNVKSDTFSKLPRLLRFDDVNGNDQMLDKYGNRIMQFLPALLDSTLASETTYGLCIAFYLDKKLSRTSMETITVCIDVRAGHGWANPPAWSIVPFIKNMIRLLDTNFAGRCNKSIVYPLPLAAVALWKLIKPFIDPNTAAKIVIMRGYASKDSELPCEMREHIEKDVIDIMEENRRSAFNDNP